MQKNKRSVVAASLLVSLALTFLSVPIPAKAKDASHAGVKTATANANQESTSGSELRIVNPPYPGPYKTVMVNGLEARQGRFPQGKFGGTLTCSIVGFDPRGFNPWNELDTQTDQLARLMFRGLAAADPYTGEIIPDLAAEIKVGKDGLSYTTRLRKGLKWSDGKPITAEDVAFTWNTIIKEGYGSTSIRDLTTIAGQSPQVTVVDELTNKFVTPKTFAPFVRTLTIAIAPKHIIEPIIKGKDGRMAFQKLWSAGCDPKTIVTDGPFVLSRYLPSQRIEFVPSKNFYMVNAQGQKLPYLSKLIFLIVPDANTNLLKFRAKEIDLSSIDNRNVVELMGKQAPENFKLWNLGQDYGDRYMIFNMNRRKNPSTNKPYVDPIKSAWFNDVNFRQAVNHAVDRNIMVANYFRGIGYPNYLAVPAHTPWCNHTLKPIACDPEYCQSLLAKSGFHKESDGYLYDKGHHRVEFDLIAPSGLAIYEAFGDMVVDDLKTLGMKVNFQPLNFNVIGDKLEHSLDWEACLFAFSSGDPLEPNDGANVFKTAGRLHLFDVRLADKSGAVKVTDARPWETQLDNIFNQGVVTMDHAKRKALYDQFQEIIYDQAPFIYLVSPFRMVGARNTVGNFAPTQLSQTANGVHNIEEIYKK